MGRIADAIGSKSPCLIEAYDATVEIQGAVARVTLTMDYAAFDEPKADGFKFLGSRGVTAVKVTDGRGQPMKFNVEYHRETLVRWFFRPPLQNDSARVVVSFTLTEPFEMDGPDANLFRAEWIGNFRIPVKKATFRLVFPPNFPADRIRVMPEGGTIQRKDRVTVQVTQEVLTQREFRVSFSPPIVKDAPRVVPRLLRRHSPLGCLVAGVLGFGFFIFMAFLCSNRRASQKPLTGFWSVCEMSSGSSSSSCSSGGSSCSSCGGGCGGGGCGGCGG